VWVTVKWHLTLLESIQPSIAIATGSAFPGIRQLGHVPDQSLSYNGDVTKDWSCTFTLCTCINVTHMNNLTFIILVLCVHFF